jgi:hypothetical protein
VLPRLVIRTLCRSFALCRALASAATAQAQTDAFKQSRRRFARVKL